MADQAQGLRELVKGFAEIREKYGDAFDAVDTRPAVDKAKLWDELKATKEAQARGRTAQKHEVNKTGAFVATSNSVQAQRDLDEMLQMETMAMIRGR